MTLKEFKELKKLTYLELSKLIGVNYHSTYRYCKGELNPTLPSLQKIIKATEGKVGMDDFIKSKK